MRKLVKAELALQTMKLRQMGAKVTVINSMMCYVKFDVDGLIVTYVYNVNKDERYFLERIKPYPVPLRESDSEEDVIDIIEVDLEQFKNVKNKSYIDKFVQINQRFSKTMQRFEDLCLYYDVNEESINKIFSEIDCIDAEIKFAKENSKRIYYKKDPEFLE